MPYEINVTSEGLFRIVCDESGHGLFVGDKPLWEMVGGSCDTPPEAMISTRLSSEARYLPIAAPNWRERRNEGRGAAAQLTNIGSVG